MLGKTPTLNVRRFYPGLVVRVNTAFSDYDGQAIAAAEIFHISEISSFPYEDGTTLRAEKTIRLSGDREDNANVIANEANRYFEPLPDPGSLRALLQIITSYWMLPEVAEAAHAEAIRRDLEACRRWIEDRAPNEAPPVIASVGLVNQTFVMQPALREYLLLLFSVAPTGSAACSEL